MLMPEAAMGEDDKPVPRQNDIRPARQIPSVEPESIAKRMDRAPDG
jgi:hypothetical protein